MLSQRILSAADAQAKLTDFLRKAVEKGKISVNPRYGTFDKKGASPGVVPPKAPTTTTTPSTAPGGPTPSPPIGP